MKANEVLPISEALRAIGNPIAYYPSFAKALGGVKVAVFLSQFLYWEGKQADEDGYIYKTQAQITEETGLQRMEQESARNQLKTLGILDEARKGVPATLHFKFNWAKLDEVLTVYHRENVKALTQVQGKGEQKDTLIFQMKTAFDEAYIKPGKYSDICYPVAYAWSKANNGGKDWAALKQLISALRQVSKNKKADIPDYEPTDEEILNVWRVVLECLPDYHRTRNFTPSLINSNLNKILQDIHLEHGKRTKNTGQNGANRGLASSLLQYQRNNGME